MAEELVLPESSNREEIYQAILPQIQSVVAGESDAIANQANVAAILKQAFDFFWVGFYRREGDQLVLGPFQGPLACTRIKIPNGVCGACVDRKETIIVPDVDRFPGHIACSSASKSEIVVPLILGDQVELVLDIDSNRLNDFSVVDLTYLEQVVSLLG